MRETWAERTKNYEATLFSKSRLVTNTVLFAERPDGAWCSGHTKVAPGGLPSSPPHPPSPLNWNSDWAKGPVLCLLPAVEAIPPLPNPPSRLPLPSCSGHCPNASTSHLGLAKPVPTVGGQAWHTASRALTPDGNTMAQGLAGWLG